MKRMTTLMLITLAAMSTQASEISNYRDVKDYKQEAALNSKAAEQGDVNAQANLGWMYDNGRGVVQDYKQAVVWYRKAAEQGDVGSQYRLGGMYYLGNIYGLPTDKKQAFDWYYKTAIQGFSEGQYRIGWAYKTGMGVEQDYKQAIFWYKKAADQGNTAAQYELGDMYRWGLGVPKDDSQVIFWHRKSAEGGLAAAQTEIALRYSNGKGVQRNDQLAFIWFSKAADQGDDTAQTNLIRIYAEGIGVQQDYKQSYVWASVVASKSMVGVLYEDDIDVAIKKLTPLELAEAQYKLSIINADGRGSQYYKTENAYMWSLAATTSGFISATDVRDVSARELTPKAIANVQEELGWRYENGKGVPQNFKKAYAWYLVSVTNGNSRAAKELDRVARLLTPAKLEEAQTLAGLYSQQYPSKS